MKKINTPFFTPKTVELTLVVPHFLFSTFWPDSCANGDQHESQAWAGSSLEFVPVCSFHFWAVRWIRLSFLSLIRRSFFTAKIAEEMISVLRFLLSTSWPDSCEAEGPLWGPELEAQRLTFLLRRVTFKAYLLSLRAQIFCFCIGCFPFRKARLSSSSLGCPFSAAGAQL